MRDLTSTWKSSSLLLKQSQVINGELLFFHQFLFKKSFHANFSNSDHFVNMISSIKCEPDLALAQFGVPEWDLLNFSYFVLFHISILLISR